MLLADILHILLDEVDSINYTNQEFYELLFLRAESPTGLELEDTVKKVFSNSKGRRPLPGNIAKQFCSRKGFLDLKDDFTQSMVFSPDGNFLLICTFDDCIEYDFTADISYTVSKHLSDDNEAFVGADYISKHSAIHVSSGQAGHIGQSTGNEIAIAVAARKSSSTVRPRCDYYRRLKHDNSIAYQRKWGYYIPTLPLELAEAFVHQNHDVGVGCAYNEDGMQSYWLTQGFFIDTSSATDQFLTVECFKYEPKNQTRKKQSPKKLERFQFLYVRHDFCIDNPQRVGGTHIVTATSMTISPRRSASGIMRNCIYGKT